MATWVVSPLDASCRFGVVIGLSELLVVPLHGKCNVQGGSVGEILGSPSEIRSILCCVKYSESQG